MRLEPETEHQEEMGASTADMTDGRKERTACQEETVSNPGAKESVVELQEIPNEDEAIHLLRACRKEMLACQEETVANPGAKESVVELQEIPNEEEAIHLLRACRKEMLACQETTEARVESEERTSVNTESEAEHREDSKEHAAVETGKAQSKRHRDRYLAADRRQRNWPEETVDPGGSWLLPRGRCPAVQKWHGARGTSSRITGSVARLSEEPEEYGRSRRECGCAIKSEWE
jgi:hypothetical protein